MVKAKENISCQLLGHVLTVDGGKVTEPHLHHENSQRLEQRQHIKDTLERGR